MFRIGLASPGSQMTGRPWRALHKWGAAIVVASGLAAGAVPSLARNPDNPAAVAPVALSTLPAEAQQTYRLIHTGGPFPYPKDGIVFGNFERRLPTQARGYYREYTVKTPGSRDRGARRIVCGGKPPTQPEACYYTADHYASFRHITP